MDWNDILDLVTNGENKKVKFMARVMNENEIGPIIAAMSNNKLGGLIVIGFDLKNYHLIGSNIDFKWIEDNVLVNCYPRVHFETDTILKNEKKILVLKIFPGNSTPYFFKKKCYVCDDKFGRLASIEEESELRDRQKVDPGSEEISQHSFFTKTEKEVVPETNEIVFKKIENPDLNILKYNNNKLSTNKVPTEIELDLNERQQKVLDYLKTNFKITNKQYRNMHEVSHKTAHKELADLVNKGPLGTKGAGRSTCYVLNKSTLF